MNRTLKIVATVAAGLVAVLLIAGAVMSRTTVTSHPFGPATLGTPVASLEVLANLTQPGPIELETIASADWAVARSGLINLEHPAARKAGLEDGDEPIQVFFHVLRHPTKGTFIVDTGVETALRDAPEQSALGGFVASAMGAEKLKVHQPLGEWLAKEKAPLAGVFLTHLHLDHLTGMADVPAGTPVYTGPGEASATGLMNAFVQAATDRALAGKAMLSEWRYERGAGPFVGANDVFGDGSVWALWVPGHTPGSTAYLVRTTKGPVLLVGDASHTRWGWEHDVEPGTFTADAELGVDSFKRLKAFAAAHPEVDVRLGHQH